MPANSQPWQQVWGQATNNLEARQQAYIQQLTQVVNSLDAECNAYLPLVDQLNFWIAIAALKDEEIAENWKTIATIAPFVDVAQIWAQDSEMHRQLLYQIWNLYNDPGHLVYQAFQKWSEVDLTAFDLDTISELFLHLLNWQQQKDAKNPQKQQAVRSFPSYYQQLPSMQQVPYPPIPSGSTSSTPIQAAVELMRSGNPDAARILQRARMTGQF